MGFGLGSMQNIQASQRNLAESGVLDVADSGAPTSTTGVGMCGPGSLYTDVTNNNQYLQCGTLAAPIWIGITAGVTYHLRRRCTIAEVNAGVTLLPAILGYKYRLIDAIFVAVGGAASGATTVDLLATQAAGSVKLVANAVAGLTQSAVLRAGAANSAVLADGASFVDNDSNTAITANKTGGALATSTSIDYFLTYELVKG